MSFQPKPTMAELREAAISQRNAIQAEIQARYDKARQDAETQFDREHDEARDAYQRIRARPRPDHSILTDKRDREREAADKALDDELRAPYLRFQLDDN